MQDEEKLNNHPTATNIILNNDIHNEVPEVTFSPGVENLLKKIIEKQDFISCKVSRNVIPTSGNSYFGDLFAVDINGRTKEGFKEINLFLKHATSGEALKPIFDINTCYSHEILIYNELSDVFSTIQENANITEKERFKMAKSYECSPDAIILENLAKKGFKTLHRMDVMPLKFAESAIAQLAKLHALSFVLKHKKSDNFENKIKTLKSALHCNDMQVWEAFVAKQFETTTQYFDKDIQKKIENFKKHSFNERFMNYYTGVSDNGSDLDSVKCLCHGDFRINNVMFKQDGEEISEMVIIDYQMVCYGSPVVDLFHFIFTGTDGKFRKAHMNNLKDLYHEELTKFLKHFNLDINDVYPKKVYEKDFHDSLEFGLMVALNVSPVIFTVEEQAPDFGKGDIDDITYKMDDRYKDRITEIIEDYVAWGILK